MGYGYGIMKLCVFVVVLFAIRWSEAGTRKGLADYGEVQERLLYIYMRISLHATQRFAVWIAREGRGGCDLRVTSYELRGTTDLGRVKSVAG